MQKFEYRSPRYDVDLPVRLRSANSIVQGRCKEISKEGLRAEFPERVPIGSYGTATVTYRESSLEIRVRVAHTGGDSEGLKFLFQSDADRKAVDHMIDLITSATARPGPVLVK